MNQKTLPGVGDEVEYAPGSRAIVTDIRADAVILRTPAQSEWPADNPERLVVTEARADRVRRGVA